jgi:hypothetical protein
MKRIFLAGVLSAAIGFGKLPAQVPTGVPDTGAAQAANVDDSPIVLDWVPPALTELSTQAAVKSNFTLDRNLLAAAASLMSDADAQTKQAIAKIDGISVHTLRFGEAGIADEVQVNSVRQAYHLRGWKHLVTTTNAGGPVHNRTTDVWLVLDGVNVRGAVVLAETPKSLTLVTLKGNLSSVDLLHLRGRFGIPNLDGDKLLDSNKQ